MGDHVKADKEKREDLIAREWTDERQFAILTLCKCDINIYLL